MSEIPGQNGHALPDLQQPVRAQQLTLWTRSLRPLSNHIDHDSTWRTNSQRELVSRYRDKGLLNGAIPVWEGAAFDVKCKAKVFFEVMIPKE
jgi:hypothetical protein